MYLVSIIIPIYNTEKYLLKCFESIKNQSYKNIEIILVNDGSTDDSSKICQDYVDRDKRFKYFFQTNQGLSAARNTGLEMMKGDFVCFIDSDDYIEHNFVEVLLNACLSNNVNIATCGRILIDNSKTSKMFILNNEQKFSQKNAIEYFLNHKYFDGSVCDKIFCSKLFTKKRFNVGHIAEDLPITVDLFLQNESIFHVGIPLYNYFKRSNSITTKSFQSQDLTILLSAREVESLILTKYPELESLTRSYYYKYLLYIFDNIYISSFGKIESNDLQLVRNILKLNIKNIILNKNLYSKYKIFLLLYFLKLHKTRNLYIKIHEKLNELNRTKI